MCRKSSLKSSSFLSSISCTFFQLEFLYNVLRVGDFYSADIAACLSRRNTRDSVSAKKTGAARWPAYLPIQGATGPDAKMPDMAMPARRVGPGRRRAGVSGTRLGNLFRRIAVRSSPRAAGSSERSSSSSGCNRRSADQIIDLGGGKGGYLAGILSYPRQCHHRRCRPGDAEDRCRHLRLHGSPRRHGATFPIADEQYQPNQ